MTMNVDFITIAGQPVRVTSLREDAATGVLTLVVIARGTVDRRQLTDLLAASPVQVELPQTPPRSMDVTAMDERVVGTGEHAITRFAIELSPSTAAASGGDETRPEYVLAARLDRIEATLEEILTLLRNR